MIGRGPSALDFNGIMPGSIQDIKRSTVVAIITYLIKYPLGFINFFLGTTIGNDRVSYLETGIVRTHRGVAVGPF
jgi:hypothetical protein